MSRRCRQYAQLAKHFDDTVLLAERDAVLARAQNSRAELAFRSTNQLASTRREWDLNRPDALKLDRPARESDSDARLGASSLQKFTGEDLSAGERSSEAKTQCREWWEQQAAERAAAAAAEGAAEAASAEQARYCDEMQVSCTPANLSARTTQLRTIHHASSDTLHHKEHFCDLTGSCMEPHLYDLPAGGCTTSRSPQLGMPNQAPL